MSFTIAAIGGSLRKGSFNTALLHTAQELTPPDITFTIHPIGELPLYNQDIENPLPAPVKALKDAIKAADAIVIATPEYDYSIPGFLKNALDWISRPHGDNSMEGKAVAIMGASSGLMGSSRSQYHLRQVLFYLNTHQLNRPEIFITNAAEKFDAEGKLTDEKARGKIKEMLEGLKAWTEQLRK